MRFNKKKKSNIKLYAAIVVALALISIGVGLYYISTHNTNNNVNVDGTPKQSIDLDSPTDDQIKAGQDTKKDAVDNDTKNPEPTPVTAEIPVAQTFSSKSDSNYPPQTYQLRYLIDEQLNVGTCTLTLVKGNVVVTKTAAVQQAASSSTCQGFDIPLGELSAGTWQVKLTVISNGRTGEMSSTIDI